MPNWCSNDLTVSGPAEDIKKFLDESYVMPDKDEEGKDHDVPGARTDGSYLCLLRAHVPMPGSLNITSGSQVSIATAALFGTDEEVQKYLDYPWAKEKGLFSRENIIASLEKDDPKAIKEAHIGQENVAKYGSRDWYDWCSKNWGTKWGDCDTVLEDQEPAKLKFRFNTAWSPPEPALDKMSKKWPMLKFSLRYYECGMGFKGSLILKNGEVLSQSNGSYRGNRGG